MWSKLLVIGGCLASLVASQQAGSVNPEVHPTITTQTCTLDGGCQTQTNPVVLDANWRWVHNTNGYTNCYTGNTWDTQYCPDGVTCANNCALDGASYQSTYGVTGSGSTLQLDFVTWSQQKNVGSRLYLMENDETYQMFYLKNREFTFDVDVSNLPCGLNGALYFVQMEADGGMSRFPTNKAGAKYGTGYCDSQCPQDLKFIDGEANCEGWVPSTNNPNSGTGMYGTCCTEMDIWEANSMATAVTPHLCSVNEQYRCNGTECGAGSERYAGVCDKDGCDYNPFRMGQQSFYGQNKIVDTTQPFTVVTQFITSNNTDDGDLVEIRRLYVQNGKVIPNPYSATKGMEHYDSISDDFCTAQKTTFGDKDMFETIGGLSTMGDRFESGMVLVMSLWDDYAVNMLWLDSAYPTDVPSTDPGVMRGNCSTSSGVPSQVESQYPNAYVKYMNIKFGEINSTYTA